MLRQTVEDKALAWARAAIEEHKLPADESVYAVKVFSYKMYSDTVQVTFLLHGFIQVIVFVGFVPDGAGFVRFKEFNQVYTVRDQPQRFPVAGANKVGYDYAGIVMTAYNWGDALRAAEALNKIRLSREQVIGMALEPKE